MGSHPVTRISHWRSQLAKPFDERFGIGSAGLVEYLALDAIKNDIADRPSRAMPSPALMADLAGAIRELPAPVKTALGARFAGVFLVDGIVSSGYTEEIRDDAGIPVAGFVVLDSKVLADRTANEWATWREGTPFQSSPHSSLRAIIERPEGDSRKNALQYILLHELGHVLSIGGRVHPSWNESPPPGMARGRFPFFDLSWGVARDGSYETPFDATFPERRLVVYYFGAKLPADSSARVYGVLAGTNFPTLYASTHPAEDFAESFASYVHTQLLGRPFEIAIGNDGAASRRFTACWTQPRCAAKRKILEGLLAPLSPGVARR